MAKVEMNGFTVHNVEPCPKCGATEYASRNSVMKMVIMCCDKCDYEAPGAILFQGHVSLKGNRKGFIEATRNFFNHWNEGVAQETGVKAKRVRIFS